MTICFPRGFERRHEAIGAHGYRLGSSSKSSSSSSSSTANTDARGVADNGSLVLTGSSSSAFNNANITLTDHGVVDMAAALIAQQQQENSTSFSNMLTTLGMGHRDNAETLQLISDTFESVADSSISTLSHLVERAFDSADASAVLGREMVSLTNNAFNDATSQAQGNKNLVYVGLLIAGVVAIQAFSKG
jgi:hypothetical protein